MRVPCLSGLSRFYFIFFTVLANGLNAAEKELPYQEVFDESVLNMKLSANPSKQARRRIDYYESHEGAISSYGYCPIALYITEYFEATGEFDKGDAFIVVDLAWLKGNESDSEAPKDLTLRVSGTTHLPSKVLKSSVESGVGGPPSRTLVYKVKGLDGMVDNDGSPKTIEMVSSAHTGWKFSLEHKGSEFHELRAKAEKNQERSFYYFSSFGRYRLVVSPIGEESKSSKDGDPAPGKLK